MTEPNETPPRSDVTINDFVDELVVALMNTRMYWTEHPRVAASISQLRQLLPEIGRQSNTDAIEILIAEDRLIYDCRPLLGATLSAPRLITAIQGRGGGGLRLACTAGEDEFRALLQLLVDKPRDGATLQDHNADLVRAGCHGITLLAPTAPTEGTTDPLLARIPVRLYQSMVETLQDTMILLCHGGTIHFDKSQRCVESVLRSLRDEGSATMLNAVRYERYDAYTFGHSIRVAVLALEFARSLTDDDGLLNRIGVAAMLHDVGKVRVPFEVLHCRTRLDDEQRREMEKHPAYGAEILMDQKDCDPMAYGAAFGHHIGSDGKGYPKLLHHPDVSLVTRIVKICDVYEALTAVRPYKESMSPVRAFRIMIGMGDVFDRPLLKKFIRTIGAFPAGTMVELTTGQIARVVRQSMDVIRPVVELDPLAVLEGAVAPEEKQIVDLASDPVGGCLGCAVARMWQGEAQPAAT